MGDAIEELRTNRSKILDLAAEHGARDLRVFGSVARGEASDTSDVDLLVRMERGRSLLDLVGLWQDLEDLLGSRVDLVSERGLDPYIRDQVERDAIPL